MILAQKIKKKQKSLSKKISIFHPTNKIKVFLIQKSQPSNNYVQLCTQYLVGNPFAEMTASMRCGMEAISLWHCWGVMEAQDASIAALSSSTVLGLVTLNFLFTISHRFSMGFRSGELAGQLSTVIPWSVNHLPVVLALWAGARSCWKNEIFISIKLFSRWKHEVLQNLLIASCIDPVLD